MPNVNAISKSYQRAHLISYCDLEKIGTKNLYFGKFMPMDTNKQKSPPNKNVNTLKAAQHLILKY